MKKDVDVERENVTVVVQCLLKNSALKIKLDVYTKDFLTLKKVEVNNVYHTA